MQKMMKQLGERQNAGLPAIYPAMRIQQKAVDASMRLTRVGRKKNPV
jgi:hypothetical protein